MSAPSPRNEAGFKVNFTPVLGDDESSGYARRGTPPFPPPNDYTQLPQQSEHADDEVYSIDFIQVETSKNDAPHFNVPTNSKDKRRNSGASARLARNPSMYELPVENVNKLILKANEPPDMSELSLDDILKNIKARKYYLNQFRRIQQQTEMHPFTLRFSTRYEPVYSATTQRNSIRRTRLCLSIGFFSLLIYFINQVITGKSKGQLAIVFGSMLAYVFLAIGLTFNTPFASQHLEKLVFSTFLICGIGLIIEKALEKTLGPILPLFMLLVAVFGITRMRFTYSCLLGWILFFAYVFTFMVIAPNDKEGFRTIAFHGVNYFISVVGGMISHYRQELLRRRNFALELPFDGQLDKDGCLELQSGEQFSHHLLLHRWSRAFKDKKVEECFYKFWYLIDPFPFENPNAGTLHAGVFRTIRFAVFGLILNQAVLGIQDYRFLDGTDYILSLVLRYSVVVPAYLSAGCFLYFLGKTFYNRWIKQANEATTHTINQLQSPATESQRRLSQDLIDEYHRLSTDQLQLRSPAPQASGNEPGGSPAANSENGFFSKVISKGGYVRLAQIYAAVVVSLHITAMGLLLLFVSDEIQPKPVYYMGFLNAILFAHRSGFRVRFVYATHSTIVIAACFIVATSISRPSYFQQYTVYVLVVLLLAMMISYEEEGLRRRFFVLKSIRSLEFQEWFMTVLKIQGWMKAKLKRRMIYAQGKVKGLSDQEIRQAQAQVLENPSANMTKASKVGVLSQAANVALGAVAELV